MVTVKTVTVEQVLDAMETDPTPKAYETYSVGDGSYCAVGGAARKLDVVPWELAEALANVTGKFGVESNLQDYIFRLNDGTNLRKATIAKRIRQRLSATELETGLVVKAGFPGYMAPAE